MHDFRKAAMMPPRLAAEANHLILVHPLNPMGYTPAGRAMAAACKIFESGTRHYQKPTFGLTSTEIDGEAVAVHEEVVARLPFGQLKRFGRAGDETGALGHPRLLIVAPLSGHFSALLRDTVLVMLPNHDVYIADWRDAAQVPLREGTFDLDDYIDYLMHFLSVIGPGCHALAICQLSVPLLVAVAHLSAEGDPVRPRSMTMNLDRHVGAHMRLYQNLPRGDGDGADQHRAFYDEYRAVMDLPAEYHLQAVQRVCQEHQLAVGTFHHQLRPDDRGRRQGRYLRRRTNQGGPGSVQRPARCHARTLGTTRCGPLWRLQRPPLATGNRAAHQGLHLPP
jgi:poly(3-hydroxybutyrate) depolymerase